MGGGGWRAMATSSSQSAVDSRTLWLPCGLTLKSWKGLGSLETRLEQDKGGRPQ